MAKAIAIVPVPAENQQGRKDEILRKLADAPVEHAEAMLSLWQLLETAHEAQVLDLARGMLSSRDFLVTKAAEGARNHGSVRAMRNGIMLLEMLGSLDPEALHALVKALPGALQQGNAAAQSSKAPSAWASVRGFLSPDGRRALALFSTMAVALGRALGPTSDHSKR